MDTFEPFSLHGFWACDWVKVYMPGFTCGQLEKMSLRRLLGWGWGIILPWGREWQRRERQTVSGALFNRIQQTDQNKTTTRILIHTLYDRQ